MPSNLSGQVFTPNLSEVVRAGLRKVMEEDGATALYLFRQDLAAAAAKPTEEVDLRELLLGPKGCGGLKATVNTNAHSDLLSDPIAYQK